MFDQKIYQIISMLDAMEPEEQSKAVKEIVKHYAEASVDNAMHLMGLIPEIGKIQLASLSKIATANYQAAEWAVNLQEMKLGKKNGSAYFAAMVPTAMVLFKNGTSEGDSLAKKRYFDTFIELYKKEFSWDKDRTWAENFGYAEFFKLLDKNIQEGNL